MSSSASAFAARDDMSVLDDSEQNESNNGESYECAFIEKRCKRWDKVAPPRDHDLSLFVAQVLQIVNWESNITVAARKNADNNENVFEGVSPALMAFGCFFFNQFQVNIYSFNHVPQQNAHEDDSQRRHKEKQDFDLVVVGVRVLVGLSKYVGCQGLNYYQI